MAALLDNVPRLAPVRRDDQAAADRPCAGQHRGAAQARACTAACSRCSTWCSTKRSATTGASSSSQLALADTDRRVAEGKPVAPSFLLACMLWHDVLDGWQKLRRRRRAAVPGAAAGDRRRVRRAHRRHLGPRQAGRRHARDLDDAAALRAPRRQRGRSRWSSSRAFAPASTSCACAPMSARSTASWPTGGKTFRSATTTSARRCWRRGARAGPRRSRAVRAPSRADGGARCRSRPKRRRRRAQASCGAARKRRRSGGAGRPRQAGAGTMNAGRDARVDAFVGLGANLGDARAQVLSGVRGAACACPRRSWSRCSSLYRIGAGRRDRAPTTSTPWSRCSTTLDAARSCCSALQAIERAAWPRPPVRATRRARSTSTCCCTASSAADDAGADAAAPAPARARLRARAAAGDRAAAARGRPGCVADVAAAAPAARRRAVSRIEDRRDECRLVADRAPPSACWRRRTSS